MNKKGFLLAEETLKIVIALISIGFLVYFLVALYISNQDSKNLELAEESLDHLLSEADSGITVVDVYNPKKWVISSWPVGEDYPLLCSNVGWSDCLCICKDYSPWDCDEKGICLESDFKIEGEVIPIIDPPLKLSIDKENKIITLQ
jgi:hypothetical protein